MSSLRFSRVPAIDTALKLVTVAVAMFAFVFVVMVPLYNVLCDALGINGKTSSQAYTAVPAAVDESREVTVQFVAINNDGMPWSFTPDTRMMRVNPGAANGVVFPCLEPYRRRYGGAGHPQYLAQSRCGLSFTKPNASALISRCSTVSRAQRCRCSSSWIRVCPRTFTPSHFHTHYSMSPAR